MAISTEEKLASSAYWITGWCHVGPFLPGTMETGEMAHVQGLYAGITFGTGAPALPDVGSLKPLWRGGTRRR